MPEEEMNPKLKGLLDFKEDLNEQEYEKAKELLKSEHKMVTGLFTVYNMTKDKKDTLHSLKLFLAKQL